MRRSLQNVLHRFDDGSLGWVWWVLVPLAFVSLALYASITGVSDSCRFLGLPYSDAQDYFDGAIRLTKGLTLTLHCGFRPLYTGYLASWLELTGNSIFATFAVQAALTSLTICWFCWQVALRHGRLIALAAGFIVSAFFVRFVGKAMTENVGLPLALVAWGWLIAWERTGHRGALFLGYFSLALGLVARTGPLFILPALLLSVRKGTSRPTYAKTLVSLVLVAGSAFALSRLYQSRFGTETTTQFGNFADTLYGVARGGKGWQYAATALPQQRASQLVYKAAIDSIVHEPHLFVWGALRALGQFLVPNLMSATGFASRVVPRALQPLVWLSTQLCYLVGLFELVRSTALSFRAKQSLYHWTTLGLLLSIPFAPPSDTDLMRGHVMAIPLVSVVVGMGLTHLLKISGGIRALEKFRGEPAASAESAPTQRESPLLRFLPHVVLASTVAFMVRPLLRPLGDVSAFGDGEPHVRLGQRGPRMTTCSRPGEYLLTVERSSSSRKFGSLSDLERFQSRAHSMTGLFEPLRSVIEVAGAFELFYGFVRETGNTWSVLVPVGVMNGRELRQEPVRVCASEVDSSMSGPQGELHALLVRSIQ